MTLWMRLVETFSFDCLSCVMLRQSVIEIEWGAVCGPAPLRTARRDTYPSRLRGENVTDIILRIRPGVGVGVGADQEPGV